METSSALLAICAGYSPVTGEFPAQRPVTRSFDVFFDLRPNKRLSKQWWGWWFETPSCPLWRHCNVYEEPGSHMIGHALGESSETISDDNEKLGVVLGSKPFRGVVLKSELPKRASSIWRPL